MPTINTYNIMEELPIEQLIKFCIQDFQGNCYYEN